MITVNKNYLKWGYQYLVIVTSGFFDRDYYREAYPDVRQANINPLWHFISMGWRENRNPSPDFDTEFYLKMYPDVREAGVNPLVHFIRHGRKEGRKPKLDDLLSGDLLFREFKIDLLGEDAENRLLDAHKISLPDKQPDIYAVASNEELEGHKEKLSVIIPTLNAGDEFENLVKIIRHQKGLNEIEIILVDSGSSDNTVKIANTYQAKVIHIKPEDFSHAYARNLGAENAAGEYLFFTVQDALIPTTTWLYEVLSVLKDNDISAVSCAELPREDADLFYRIISWNHYKFLGVEGNDRIFEMPPQEDYFSLRKNGQLSDIALLIPRTLFLEFKHRINYAEDLDLGINLIRAGHKTAFLGSIRIIHSHNRPAYYFLKRGYVDNLFLSDLFDDFPVPDVRYENLIADIAFTFNFILDNIAAKIKGLDFPVSIDFFKNLLVEMFEAANYHPYLHNNVIVDDPLVNAGLRTFLEQTISASNYTKTGQNYDGNLVHALKGFLNIAFNYLEQTYEVIDRSLADEIVACLIKETALISGAHFAAWRIKGTDQEREKFQEVHRVLTVGV